MAAKNGLKAWLVYGLEDAERNRWMIRMYGKLCNERGIELKLIYAEHLAATIMDGKAGMYYYNRPTDKPDFVIMRAIFPRISYQLELMGIPVYNNSMVADICNDKAKTYQLVSKTGVKMVDTLIVDWEWMKGANLEGLIKELNIHLPCVIKPCNGRSGSDVYMASSMEELMRAVERMEGRDFVLQKTAGRVGQDLRVFCVGGKIITAILRSSAAPQEEFRANFCLGGTARVYELSSSEEETVMRVVNLLNFGFVGVDFLFAEDGELLFNEIEDVVGARTVYVKTDINIAERYIDYIIDDIL